MKARMGNIRRQRPAPVRQKLCGALLLALVTCATPAWAQRNDAPQAYSIQAGDLAGALDQLASQSKVQILYPSELVRGKRAEGFSGRQTWRDALAKLLTGTGLTYGFVNDTTVVIRRDESKPRPADRPKPSRSGAQASQDGGEEVIEFNPIVVTGTHIRGAAPVGAPVLVFTREDFDRSGAATAQQFLAKLPQNFGGGRTEDTNKAIPDGGVDRTYGSAVNLRGLGSGSTLVLVNGRRTAVSGEQEYVDISMIPLSAVERIEVLLDGASALYGSDAIGGVVNLILREQYTGAETQLRIGGTTQGGGEEYQIAQSFGAGWKGGNVLLTLERYRKNAISNLERDFSAEERFPQNLAAGARKDAVHIHASQELSDGIRLFGDFSFAEREVDDRSTIDPNPALFTSSFHGDVRQRGGSVGTTIDIGSSWQGELVAGASRIELDGRLADHQLLEFGFGEGLFKRKSDARYVEAKASGDLFSLPAGDVRLAVGAGARKQRYESRAGFEAFGLSEVQGSREKQQTDHVFAELFVPVIGGATATSKPRLALSLAGRYEKSSYSSGTRWSSTDPKFGVQWAATDAVQFRGTYGTSFKGPTIVHTDDVFASWGLLRFADPQSPTEQRQILLGFGGNPNLQPETATTWTAGLDITPQRFPGFRAGLTYFDIDYRDRISSIPTSNMALVFYDPAFVGVRTLRNDVGDADFGALASEILAGGISGCRDENDVPLAGTSQPCPLPPGTFDAIVDARLRNLAVSRDRGIDLNLTQHIELGEDESFEFALNGTYLFDFVRQFTADAPEVELVSTVYQPTDLRLQARGTWQRRDWTITGAVHYNDAYVDNSIPGDLGRIGSWTTFDLNMSYDTGRRFSKASWFNDTMIALNVDNVFDRDPPPFRNHFNRLGFDPANSDPYGRAISLTLRKSW